VSTFNFIFIPLLKSKLVINMKIFIICAALIALTVAYNDEVADDKCLKTNEAAKCFRDFSPCKKAAKNGWRLTEKCLWTFSKCLEGTCMTDCKATYRTCMHKTGNRAADLQKCRVDDAACVKVCPDNIFVDMLSRPA